MLKLSIAIAAGRKLEIFYFRKASGIIKKIQTLTFEVEKYRAELLNTLYSKSRVVKNRQYWYAKLPQSTH